MAFDQFDREREETQWKPPEFPGAYEVDEALVPELTWKNKGRRPEEGAGVYSEEFAALEATWVLFRKEPGLDGLYDLVRDWLNRPNGMLQTFKVMPVNIRALGEDEPRVLYQARFEMGQYKQPFAHDEAILSGADGEGTVAAWIDFVGGFPLGCLELLTLVGEISSKPDLKADQLAVQEANNIQVAPPYPQNLFAGYAANKLMLNFIFIDTKFSRWLPPDLYGEDKMQSLHWWFRVNLMADIQNQPQKWPVPGEFMALAVRIMPDRFWHQQETNPFLFSGNFLDTVYFTAGFVDGLEAPTPITPWQTCKITWHDGKDYEVIPTDFTDYQVGDRVPILKDITTTKQTEQWKDDDMQEFGGPKGASSCNVVPIMFYDIN